MRPVRITSDRSRRRRSGAVLVEGLIVASMLGLFLAGAVFVHSLYSTKLRLVTEARREAWMKALPGCEGGLLAGLLNSFGVITTLTEIDQSGAIDTPDWLTGMGRGTGDPAPMNVAASPLLGGGSHSLQAHTSVACNEFGDDDTGSLLLNMAGLIREVVPF